ncbi:MAG TPA: hypothetical protein VFZ21_25440 [Gemmatimonadaceae bacterium]|nr:hypothetical protein [Gemmatimonadaceae bacterium]
MSTVTASVSKSSVLAAAVFALSGVVASTARAQDFTGSRGFEFRPYAGAYIPTGDQRDLLEDAVLVGAQASYRILPQFAITGTFGWSPSKDRIAVGDQKIDLYQYDVGAELRAPSWFTSGALDFTPFAGLGVGGRTYDYRDLDVDAKSNIAGFGVLGGELGFGRAGFRVEARDYVSRFKPFDGGDSKTRNDVTVAAGLTLRF